MTAFQLTNYDFLVNENKAAHNCGAYIGNDLVVRRGQEFNISMTFNAPVQNGDRLQFIATLNTSSGGTGLLEYTFSDSSSGNSWAAKISGYGSPTITVAFMTPNDAVIGRYILSVQANGGTRRVGEFMLIFNPWAPGDSVFLADPAQRNEYVLQEFGLICVGEVSNQIAAPWNYGQVNSKDDSGVVEGNWSGDYSDGTNPSAWNGSTSILKSWNQQKQPVKYGQCWVFAGVLCTVSRALGLPCRIITNYNSAHDSNGNLSIEEYYDVYGEPVMEGDDSIWNFHCWNEGWFTWTDLDASYSGWQIYDSTPQETSDGIYELGPTSQRAVKEGEVDKPHDTRFVYSEVNADVVKVVVQQDGRKAVGETDRTKVGQFICTKAVGTDSYVNITSEYKYPEGSSEDKQSYDRARQLAGVRSGFVAFSADGRSASAPSRKVEVSGEISVSGSPSVGDDVEAVLTLKNLTPKTKNVTVNISAAAIVYNKAVRRKIFNQSVTVTLSPNEGNGQAVPACLSCIPSKRKKKYEKEIPIKIAYYQYENVLTPDNIVNVTAVCQVEDWGDVLVENNTVLKKPTLGTKALGPAELGKPVTVEVRFTNPLPVSVKNCVLTMEGSGLIKDEVKKSLDVLDPDHTMKVVLDLEPYVSGEKKLLMNFTCDKFTDVKAFMSINVTGKS